MLGCLLHCINGFLVGIYWIHFSWDLLIPWRSQVGAKQKGEQRILLQKALQKRSDALQLKREVRIWPFQRDACNFYHDFHNSIPYNYAFQSHLKLPIKTDGSLYLYTLLWDIIIRCCQSQFYASPWSKIRIRTRKCSFLYNDHLNPNEPTEAERT